VLAGTVQYGPPAWHLSRATGEPDLPPLWARRSAFQRGGAPLLITEVFLPAIRNLAP